MTISLRQSINSWWNHTSLEDAEIKVLSLLSFFPESDGKRKAELNQVPIGDGLVINEFKIENLEPVPAGKKKLTLLMVHGFCESLVFYYRNYEALSAIPGITIYAIDQLGFGRSSKPEFDAPGFEVVDENGESVRAIKGEEYFVNAIEKWRRAKGITERFVFMGHSLGGYVAGAYTIKYPQYIEKVIFVSPAGVERGYNPHDNIGIFDVLKHPFKKDYNVPKHLPKYNQEMYWSAERSMRYRYGLSLRELDALEDDFKTGNDRLLTTWQVYTFVSQYSPFSILKYTGFLTPKIASAWALLRFSYLEPKEKDALLEYIYWSLKDYSNGSTAFRAIFGPSVAARRCLRDRIDGIKVPSLWLYGANDFISPIGAQQCAKFLNQGDAINYRKASVFVLNRCAHHLHIENPNDFEKLVISFLENNPKEKI